MELFNGLGIDIRSILIYAVNFGIIVWIIAKFFSGPIIEAIEKRTNIITDNLTESEKLKKQIQKQQKQMEEDKAEYKLAFDKELGDIKDRMNKEREEMIKEMTLAREKSIQDAEKDIAIRKEKIFEDSRSNLAEVVHKSLIKILSKDVPAEVVEESIDTAWKQHKE